MVASAGARQILANGASMRGDEGMASSVENHDLGDELQTAVWRFLTAAVFVLAEALVQRGGA